MGHPQDQNLGLLRWPTPTTTAPSAAPAGMGGRPHSSWSSSPTGRRQVQTKDSFGAAKEGPLASRHRIHGHTRARLPHRRPAPWLGPTPPPGARFPSPKPTRARRSRQPKPCLRERRNQAPQASPPGPTSGSRDLRGMMRSGRGSPAARPPRQQTSSAK